MSDSFVQKVNIINIVDVNGKAEKCGNRTKKVRKIDAVRGNAEKMHLLEKIFFCSKIINKTRKRKNRKKPRYRVTASICFCGNILLFLNYTV
jgi:hypothetical protein